MFNAFERIASIPVAYKGKWSWRDLPDSHGIPFDNLHSFVIWITHGSRLYQAPDLATAVAMMKRGFCYKWTQPSSDRFWFVDAPIAFREARSYERDNNYPSELANVNFMVLDRLDRVEKRDHEFLEAILHTRINQGKVTVYTARSLNALSSEIQDVLMTKALIIQ